MGDVPALGADLPSLPISTAREYRGDELAPLRRDKK